VAVRKFIVVAGQNQATEVADAIEWETNHLYASIRSPRNQSSKTPDYSAGPYDDILTLPFTFKGGPQADVFGATTFGSHQTANVMGKATRAVKYLTFYDPTASYQNVGTATASTYPGTGKVLAGSTSTSINTSVTWQYDPTGIVITRRKTGTTHTVDSAATAGTTLTFDPAQAFVPPPETGELFDFTPTAGANGTTTTILLESEFGGNADPGSASDPSLSAAINASGEHACYINTILTSGSYGSSPVGGPARITCTSRPVYVGQPVKFSNGSSHNVPSGLTAGDTYYVTRKAGVRETVTSSGWDTVNDQLDFSSAHGLGDNEPITVTAATGSAPTALPSTTTFYVKLVDATTIEFRSAIGGSAVALESASGTATITRLDSYASFFVATAPGGDEIAITADTSAAQHATQKQRNIQVLFEPSFRGSLTGLQARCITASNALNVGESRAIHDVKSASSINTLTVEAFPATTSDGDTFAIEVPPLNNQSIPFEKWAMWLPWCPFEGASKFDGPAEVKITSTNSTTDVTVEIQSSPTLVGGTPPAGTAVKFFTSGRLPAPLVEGQVYFVKSVSGSTLTLEDLTSDTGGVVGSSGSTQSSIGGLEGTTTAAKDGSGSPNHTARHIMFVYDQEDKQNPYPPGFNYPNHHATPRAYQAFDGPGQISVNPSISFHPSLALKMHEYTGETMHVLLCAMKATSIGHKEVFHSTDTTTSHGWLDEAQQKSWSPGEPNNCFARLEDMLDAAKLAFEADGDTGECVGIFWAQGEEDARYLPLSNNYEDSARKIRAAIRKAIKDRSLTSLEEDKIPFIHPKITTAANWTYASTINTAIDTLADEDEYTRTFEVSSLELGDDENPKIHYSGVGMASFADSAYSAWKDTQSMTSKEIEICNLALAHIGDKASVTSLNPSDGSHQADLCARYYPLARDLCLERHRWDFTIRQSALVALTSSGRKDWEYGYELPSNFAGVIAVIPKDSLDDQIRESTKIPQPYAIELSADYERVIYCNLQDAVIRYQAKVTDSSKFSQMFVYAVSWQLASMLAGALIKGDEGMGAVRNATQMAEFYMQRAAAFDSRTTREKPVVDANTNPWDR
tara:strand:- start:9460 stop:12714 length:3255 start_codon:yes stop_codon:yes gene_type:complete